MEPSLLGVLERRWRDTRSRSSLLGSLREIGADLWEFILESLPERRRARYGDVEYDWEHEGMDTTSATVSTPTRLLAAISGAPYQPTEPSLFAEMLKTLTVDFRQFTFVDIGSGKGRTLLMAAEFGFRRVIGVELLPELHEVALRNIAAGGRENVASVCMDGRDFEFPRDPLVVYLFNPLPATALIETIANLHASLEQQARAVKIIYHNPLSEHVLAHTPFLRRISATNQYAIYSN